MKKIISDINVDDFVINNTVSKSQNYSYNTSHQNNKIKENIDDYNVENLNTNSSSINNSDVDSIDIDEDALNWMIHFKDRLEDAYDKTSGFVVNTFDKIRSGWESFFSNKTNDDNSSTNTSIGSYDGEKESLAWIIDLKNKIEDAKDRVGAYLVEKFDNLENVWDKYSNNYIHNAEIASNAEIYEVNNGNDVKE